MRYQAEAIAAVEATDPASEAHVTGQRLKRKHKNPNKPAYEEPANPIGTALKVVVLVVITLAVLYPLWTILITSLSDNAAVTRTGGMVSLPRGLTLDAYKQIIEGGVVTRAALVSTFITVVGTLLSTTVSVMAAYGLSRPGSLWHRPILFIFLVTMFFGAGLIPSYLVVTGLGLKNSLWSLILPGAVSAFNVLILRNFFMGIEPAIIEAARIDGAGDWKILRSVVLPMSTAVVAVVALFYGVGYWNAFFNAILYIDDNTKWPLQLVLRSYVLQGSMMPGQAQPTTDVAHGQVSGLPVKMAIVVLAVIPILIVYPFVQRHFTKGVIFGAVKG